MGGGCSLPALAVLIAVYLTNSVVLIRGEELRAGGRETVLVVSALEAGQDTLTKQILTRLPLQEMVETQILWLLSYKKKAASVIGEKTSTILW